VSKQRQAGRDPGAGLQTVEAVGDAVLHSLGGKDAGELVGQPLDRPGELDGYWPRHGHGSYHPRLMSAESDA
jgi:hypothetical protein